MAYNFNFRAEQCSAVYAMSESVCLSVHHTCEPRLNGSRCRDILHIFRQRNIFSFLTPNFPILYIGLHPQRMRSKEAPALEG